MNALRKIHWALAASGILLDHHPTALDAHAVCGGEELGRFDQRGFRELVEATDAVPAELFALEDEIVYEVVDAFGSASELVETAAGWRGFAVPPSLEQRIHAARPPWEVHQEVVLRRFRAL